jgi:hypothetical protein
MSFPKSSRVEVPILQELLATEGEERVRLLYRRLAPYFPQLTREDLTAKTKSGKSRWESLVQRAGRALVEKGELLRAKGRWQITDLGRRRAEAEVMVISPPPVAPKKGPLSHDEIKKMLVEIGRALGKHAEEEFLRYDVVWKESALSPRISHVFEVQVKGKIESALAKLKHAYDTQRSKPCLVVADERNSKRAAHFLRPYLSGSFHEIGSVATVLGVEDVVQLHQAIHSVKETLDKLLDG